MTHNRSQAAELAMAAVAAAALGLVSYGILAFVRAETASTALWLNAMHIGAAIPIVGTLSRHAKTGRARE